MARPLSNEQETFGDKLRAFALAIGVHVLCVLVALVGLWWTSETKPVVMPGPIIEATLVGPTAAPKSGARNPAPPAPPKQQPEPPKQVQETPPKPPEPTPPEPKPQPKEAPPPPPKQDLVDQEKVAALAFAKAEAEKKEQEAKQRQRQIELEQEQKEREREEKAKKLKQEQLQQLADLRKQREAADKAAQQERNKLSKLEASNRAAENKPAQPQAEQEAPQAQTGANGADEGLAARYAAAIQASVTNNWNRPDSASAGLHCRINVTQIPGGDVISVSIGSPCNADDVTRNSLEQAVKRAPLPYQGYEKVFQRNITFNFRYDG